MHKLYVTMYLIYFRCINAGDFSNSNNSENSDVFPGKNGYLIEIGIETEKLIVQLNAALQGLIMTCYIHSLYTIIFMAFHMMFNVCLNNVHTAENKSIGFVICMLSIIMYLIRLRFLMNSGECLGNKIKESRRTLQDLVIAIPHSKINNFELSKPKIKKITERDKDQILNVSPLKTGQIAIRRKTIKKSIPKLLFEPIFSIRTFYITKSLQNKIKKVLKLQLFT